MVDLPDTMVDLSDTMVDNTDNTDNTDHTDNTDNTRAPADREVSIKDSGFTRTGLGVTVLCLHTAT